HRAGRAEVGVDPGVDGADAVQAEGHDGTPVLSSSAAIRSRNAALLTLVADIGHSPGATNRTWRGTLKWANEPWQCSISSASVTAAPGASSTKAATTSSRRASGAPTTSAWAMAGWVPRWASTSSGETFSPPTLRASP